MTRIAIVCPGRGSYTEASLGSLPRDHEWVRQAESMRVGYGLEPLTELDGAERFEPARHLKPSNVSALIYVVSMLDAEKAGERIAPQGSVACVAGNSMGWYTALAVGGVLSFEDGFRLVQRMSLLQEDGAGGGQVIYPFVDGDWRCDPDRARAIDEALAASEGEAFPSIRLGGFAVLAGSPRGVSHLLRELPKVQLGRTSYPFKLAQHGPYHTHLANGVADRARIELAEPEFRRPQVPLVDGRGFVFSPWSADVAALRDYTLGAQVTTPYDFTASVRVALREFAPERVVLPGPGNSLGGVCGQILVAEGWRGIRSKADFDALQKGARPVLDSMGR
ncbi:MAG: ACP S-malonyltransferase [bacterium]|nr:ACP S-malonyltransferase [bacterium]